jgi:hypothetical protein
MTTTPRAFQEATVAAAVQRLRGRGRRRFLVADEVGLGKTVVARELARVLSGGGSKPFTVYYVTSNTKVSDQNAKRLVDFLGPGAEAAVSKVDRLGLIPLERAVRPGLRLYPLSPLTSFPALRARPQTGKAGERAFIEQLLERCYPGIAQELPETFMQQRAYAGWPGAQARAAELITEVPRRFVDAYRKTLVATFGHGARKRIVAAAEQSTHSLKVLSQLRRPLAEACLLATPPDLVIFDEFQRYRELLSPAPDDRLVQALLQGANGKGPAMLLLSATPYRLFGESWKNAGGGQAHEELFELIGFLGGATVRSEAEELFGRFGSILRRIGEERDGPIDEPLLESARSVRARIHALLRPLMARTERHEGGQALEGTVCPELDFIPTDVHVFRHFAAPLAARLKTAALPYWLSVPLPAQALGKRYKISKDIAFRPDRTVPTLGLQRRTPPGKPGWGSAKLRALSTVLPVDQLALPWVAPSLPWWPLSGPWRRAPSPKLLLFSRFRASPQSIAALTSLEVERRFADPGGASYKQLWTRRKLQAKARQGATLALFHPSPLLIRTADPLKGRFDTPGQARLTVKRQLAAELRQAGIEIRRRPKADAGRRMPTWQVIAAAEKATGDYQASRAAWDLVAGDDGILASLLEEREAVPSLDWISPRELEDLVSLALGGPANAVGRAWLRHHADALTDAGLAELADFTWGRLRLYLDNPVFWGVLEPGRPSEVLQSAVVAGGFESLLDEHFWLARGRVRPEELIADLGDALSASTGSFTFKEMAAGDTGIRVRCHAAVPFGGTEASDDPLAEEGSGRPIRSQELRRAFNTPFWPHLLATTSVGQEGLDFHSWCEKVAHWDLPYNPVDLEQREGRISRYAGLLIRRPLARSVGAAALAASARSGGSPWCHLEACAETQHADESGLSPWWLLGGAAIRRLVLTLPRSRDVARFERLRRQRLLYRLALGQPNQEDLVELLANGDDERTDALVGLTLDLSAIGAMREVAG